MQVTRYLGLALPVRTSTQDGKAIDQDLSGLAYSSPPSVWDANTNPDASHDSDHGYYVGSRWLNRTTSRIWILIDDTPNAAVWQDAIEVAFTSAVSTALLLMTYGDGADGSIAYQSSHWQWRPKGSSDWQNISTTAGQWEVSGSMLQLLRQFNFQDVTIPTGTTLVFSSLYSGSYYLGGIKVNGTLTVQGSVRTRSTAPAQISRATGSMTASAGGTPTTPFNGAGIFVSRGGNGGAGGGCASFAGGSGISNPTSGSAMPWLSVFSGSATPAGGRLAGANANAVPNYLAVWATLATYPRFPGGNGMSSGAGALSNAGGSSQGGNGGYNAGGGGIIDLRAFRINILSGGAISADGQDPATLASGGIQSAGNASGADLTIAGGGGGPGGGGGGVVALGYGTLVYNGTDYSTDPYNAALANIIRAKGGIGGVGAAGKTRLDDDNALTAWGASTAYTLGTWRRPTTANGYGYVCSTAGTSGTGEPTWPTTAGNTVTDGTVVWVCIAEGNNIDNPAFKGGNGSAGLDGLVILERMPTSP